jgi:hypothetical protein
VADLLDKILENRERPSRAVVHCPAYHGPCPGGCFMRAACERDPEGVRVLMERLDAETVDAMSRIAAGGP